MTDISRRTTVRMFVWSYEDHDRGVALLRGPVKDAIELAGVTTARWSVSGKGYVVPITVVEDISAACSHLGITFRPKAVGR